MDAPLITVVLPVYNGARFLCQAIESILAQDWPNWELVVVDDASTDESPAIISAFTERDRRIRSVRNARNLKLPGALNAGFALARGELLTWASDDNWYAPDALSSMARFLLSHAAIDIVYCDYVRVDSAGTFLYVETVAPPELLAYRNVVGACFLYRRRVQECTGPYAVDLFLAEDYDFWLRASQRFRFGVLRRPLCFYREHDRSLTSEFRDDVRLVVERTLVANIAPMDWLPRSVGALAALELACRARRRGERATTRRMLLCAVRRAPAVLSAQRRAMWGEAIVSEARLDQDARERSLVLRAARQPQDMVGLVAFALLGESGARWSLRLWNVLRKPGAALRRASSVIGHALRRA